MLNRREFKRVIFNEPIISTIELLTVSIDGHINSNEAIEILIFDMSAGGLKFYNKFEFTVNFLTRYKINMKLKDKDLVFLGKIVRKRLLPNNIFEYGFKFVFD